MKSFALIGKPLGHSLSPWIHALISQAAGIECVYALRPLEPDEVRAFIRNMRDEGLDGLNATIPYKLAALESVDSLAPEARAIGAVNTVEVEGSGALTGHNTDYHGFGAMLRSAGIGVAGKRCAVLGSGGSARAAAAFLSDAGASEIWIVSRDAIEASARFPGMHTTGYDALDSLSGGLLVNCTPLGMHPHPEGCPAAEAVIGRFEAVADLVYNPRETRFLSMAARLGCKRADGLMMLVAQAARAREIWHGIRLGSDVEREVYNRMTQAAGEAP